MARPNEARDVLAYIQGGIEGLAGTVRYDLPYALRRELQVLADRANEVTHVHTPRKVKSGTGKKK